MDNSPKRPGSITVLLAGLVLLATAVTVAALVPLAACPECDGTGKSSADPTSRGQRVHHSAERAEGDTFPCGRCRTTGRLTLYRRWVTSLFP